MKVQAITNGFYREQRIRAGAVFELTERPGFKVERDAKGNVVKKIPHVFTPEEQFSESWMRKVVDGEVLVSVEPELDLPGVKLKKPSKKGGRTLSDAGDSVI